MSSTCDTELVRGIIQSGAGAAGIGTAVDISGLGTQTFNEITVFNDATGAIKVQWLNDVTGKLDDFFVPAGGKSFTRSLNKGHITASSLKVFSAGAAVTGDITINLGAH